MKYKAELTCFVESWEIQKSAHLYKNHSNVPFSPYLPEYLPAKVLFCRRHQQAANTIVVMSESLLPLFEKELINSSYISLFERFRQSPVAVVIP